MLNKKEGETPLCALENFRAKKPEYLNVPMTYAGRLDPMANGVLIVLAGEEVKEKEKYLSLDKEYDFSVLFGFSTDTYDILGKVSSANGCVDAAFASKQEFAEKINENLKYFRGKLKQKYPAYSSKTVNGKPLFSYARKGEDVDIPEREVFVDKLELQQIRKIGSESLLKNIEKRIGKVVGDFRQDEILNIWRKSLLDKGLKQSFYVADLKIKCGSGTYVRTIAHTLGEKMNFPALAFSIRRSKVGRYVV